MRGAAGGSLQPGGPVDEGVGLQVLRVAQDAHEDVFGGDVEVRAPADDQADGVTVSPALWWIRQSIVGIFSHI